MLTLTADYRIAADDLRIGLGAVRHGILPGSAPQRLAGAVGPLAARRLCLFGEYVDAAEALRIGLVDRVVPPVDLDSTAQALADRAASLSPGSLRELKRLLMQSSSLSDEEYETAYLAAQQRCLNTSFLEQPPAPGRQLQEQEAGGAGQSTRPEGRPSNFVFRAPNAAAALTPNGCGRRKYPGWVTSHADLTEGCAGSVARFAPMAGGWLVEQFCNRGNRGRAGSGADRVP
jgi:hypothetical protein